MREKMTGWKIRILLPSNDGERTSHGHVGIGKYS